MKKLIAIIFLVLLSIQILPVREIGKLIASGILTEEKPSMVEDIKEEAIKINYLQTNHEALISTCVFDSSKQHHERKHSKEEMPHSFCGDIFSPPPNFLS